MSPESPAAGFPATAVVGLIRAYQWAASPVLPVLFGPSCGCRFSPTCSHYAAEAVLAHGVITGTWLSARRLIRCTPFQPGGHDPVPPAVS
jgi:putative membrane protein insertion efficiency factor